MSQGTGRSPADSEGRGAGRRAGDDVCWVCASSRLERAKAADVGRELVASDFAITDDRYGRTGELVRCLDCGFLECPSLAHALDYYEALEDRGYEESRAPRALQMRKLLESLGLAAGARLLDVGAGSGILVEQALAAGYRAEGIEPSHWLVEAARERGLPVHEGALPSPAIRGPYDVVTLVDVIEHVSQPVELLAQARALLAPGGVVAIVTPDLGSVAARAMGWRWWHFRVAHIGYFDRGTLGRACARAGLRVERFSRPAWYFEAAYLWERFGRYLPRALRVRAPRALGRVVVPLNLRDSWLALARAAG